jgi:hypothetical protein
MPSVTHVCVICVYVYMCSVVYSKPVCGVVYRLQMLSALLLEKLSSTLHNLFLLLTET